MFCLMKLNPIIFNGTIHKVQTIIPFILSHQDSICSLKFPFVDKFLKLCPALLQLQKHSSEVFKNPNQWMSWNYESTIAATVSDSSLNIEFSSKPDHWWPPL